MLLHTPIIPSHSGTKWWNIQCCHLYIIDGILSDAIRCYATLNIHWIWILTCYFPRKLIFWEPTIQLVNYQFIYFKHVQLSQHSVWNATGLNIFKTWAPCHPVWRVRVCVWWVVMLCQRRGAGTHGPVDHDLTIFILLYIKRVQGIISYLLIFFQNF